MFRHLLRAVLRTAFGMAPPPDAKTLPQPQLPSDTTLELQEGAELLFTDDPNAYPPAFTRWEGVEYYAMHTVESFWGQKLQPA